MRIYEVTIGRRVVGETVKWVKAKTREDAICIAMEFEFKSGKKQEINSIKIGFVVSEENIIERI